VFVELDGLNVARISFEHHHQTSERCVDLTGKLWEGRMQQRELKKKKKKKKSERVQNEKTRSNETACLKVRWIDG